VSERFVVPEKLVQARTEINGAEGAAWLRRLPSMVQDCVDQWSLALDAPFSDVNLNYVAPGTRRNGVPIVLKLCYPGLEFATEAQALAFFAGMGAVQLLAVDDSRSALLLERLRPGTSLACVPDDERATHIAAVVMRRLWRPAPSRHSFPSFADWVAHMAQVGPNLVTSYGAFSAAWIVRALDIYRELAGPPSAWVLLHGDLHHGNILAGERESWLAIDPKGVLGEPVCETGPLLLNALPADRQRASIRPILERRTAQLAEELGMDRGNLRAWGVVRAVMSGFWSLEDHGRWWEHALLVAKVLADLC
jgi:streptomycin 6-kinase